VPTRPLLKLLNGEGARSSSKVSLTPGVQSTAGMRREIASRPYRARMPNRKPRQVPRDPDHPKKLPSFSGRTEVNNIVGESATILLLSVRAFNRRSGTRRAASSAALPGAGIVVPSADLEVADQQTGSRARTKGAISRLVKATKVLAVRKDLLVLPDATEESPSVFQNSSMLSRRLVPHHGGRFFNITT